MRLVAILLAAALALPACGGDTEAGGGNGAAADPIDLDFTATTIDGEEFTGGQLAGRPALLWFWAPWCPTCGAQAPAVNAVAEAHGGGVSVVGVSGLGHMDAMRQFIDRTDTGGITQLADESGEVWRHFGITAQSVYVLLDADAVVRYTGYLNNDELDDRVAELVGA